MNLLPSKIKVSLFPPQNLGKNNNDLEGKTGVQIPANGTSKFTQYLPFGESWRVFDDSPDVPAK